MTTRRLLFVVTVDWYFWSHRLPLAAAAKAEGYDVAVVTREQAHGKRIRDAGFRLVHLDWSRRSANPFSELAVVLKLIDIYRRESPDIVHHVAMKPVLYGSIAARLARVPVVVNALTGMGYMFSSQSLFTRTMLPSIYLALRHLLRRGRVIVQNSDDATLIESLGLDKPALIRGSGVDPERFAPTSESFSPPIVVLVSRLLWDKGVGEFVGAARALKAEGLKARFVLVGAPDPENRSSVPEAIVEAWRDEGVVECWGHRDDIPEVLGKANIACLPSYREGLPKSLIEAASCGLPIVTTNTPGCREVVTDGDTGFLVPPRNVDALTSALRKLLGDATLCRHMGERGRAKVLSEFAQAHVIASTLALYRELVVI